VKTTTNANGAYSFTVSESAWGVYGLYPTFAGNPSYSPCRGWLEVTVGNPIPTTLSLNFTNSNPAVSQSFTMSGYLKDTNGKPLSGKKISVDVRLPSGSWTSQGLGATTDSNGHYSITTSEQAAGEYRFEVYFLGDGTYAGHGSWALVPIGTLQPTKISATTNVANPVAGKPFTLSGTLTDAKGTPLAGKEIQLYRYAATQPNPPVIFQTRYTDQNGHYSFVLNEPSDKYMYTARFTGDQTYAHSDAVVNLIVGPA
jgi:protocatechuate 3,4-dioxygenase beta subunit